ncbi:MAG: tRNA uridine-5-carboxymethylaminomethyl(34) synthesis enzyme MnmG [Candidatus Omnitrophica bacterium]|nr:tRNA uridine-5-carboxymethylaminomethyl(34) synthesis enzyme MnmG [Candidatus Omnitrophota bacterium]
MFKFDRTYDVIVIGAGHAGCEASLVTSRTGFSTLLLTMNLDTIAQMSCNPAVGGLAKGHLVREIDALGGQMARVIDKTGIQFRMLNKSKGPAVWAPRAQADKKAYQFEMKRILESQPNLDIKQQVVENILLEGNRIIGVRTNAGLEFLSEIVIITTGTFLNGLIHIGELSYSSGRLGDFASIGLANSLKEIGLRMGRLKTGTSPRVNLKSIKLDLLEIQYGDDEPQPFSYSTKELPKNQVPCYITYTNEDTHKIVLDNLHRSPLYGGRIKGIGPRYCPSIEDKVVKFKDKIRHQIFIEPEGVNTNEAYLNGISTSLPPEVQTEILRTIKGLGEVEIMRFGYAIEYDFVFPTQLKPSLETRLLENLFLAGQINGTSGYEEAAAQGLMAGINVALKLKGRELLVLKRDEAYIGVLIDDLITKGTTEPYRMFTSQAEYRLILRQDNADERLMYYGFKTGLIKKALFDKTQKRKERISKFISYLKKTHQGQNTLAQLLSRPEVNLRELNINEEFRLELLDKDLVSRVEFEIKYEGYLNRQFAQIARFKKLENKRIPKGFPYQKIKGLRKEAIEKLDRIKPVSIGQALRISGVSPCDISLLLVYLEHLNRLKEENSGEELPLTPQNR